MITIYSVGKAHEAWIQPGVDQFDKRLQPPFDVRWELLPHSSLEGDRARREESDRIRKRLRDDTYVILLDERGTLQDSIAFSKQVEDIVSRFPNVALIIGGAYGVDDELQRRANATVSLSRMVFPHQLVRLIIMEQLYRAQSIARGTKYHHV